MWSARQKVRQETRDKLGKYDTYDAAPSKATLSFDEGGLNSDEDFERLAEEYGVDVTSNDGEAVEVHGRAQDIRALTYEVEERHGAKPDVTVFSSEDANPAYSEDIDDYTDSEEITARVTPGSASTDDDQVCGESDIRYSFRKQFELAEEKFNTDFEGIPNRFYNADLRGKYLNRIPDDDLSLFADTLAEPGNRAGRYFDSRGLTGRLCHSTSSPDENKISDEKTVELIESLDHVTEVQPIEDDKLLRLMGKNATRGWLARMEHTNERGDREERWLAVSDHSISSMKTYTIARGRGPLHANQMITQTDIRSLVGAERIARHTGENLIGRTAMHPHFEFSTMDFPDDHPDGYSHASYQQRVNELKDQGLTVSDVYRARKEINDRHYAQNQVVAVQALSALEEAQFEGRNFMAQRKHIRESDSKIATAFDDKKNPDKTRQEMMSQTSLAVSNGGTFSKVEIDNDVDPEEYADFESAIHDIESKLPSVPDQRRPDLRIRKLGKHKANGIFNATRNTVAVDVRTSEAYIHEMGHFYDLVAKDNASLSEDFRSISRSYESSLIESDPKRRGYLNTPTEQMARGFEVYAVERLGINNRLVNPSKFDRNDYAPYTEDPEMKQRIFEFFDKLFDRD